MLSHYYQPLSIDEEGDADPGPESDTWREHNSCHASDRKAVDPAYMGVVAIAVALTIASCNVVRTPDGASPV